MIRLQSNNDLLERIHIVTIEHLVMVENGPNRNGSEVFISQQMSVCKWFFHHLNSIAKTTKRQEIQQFLIWVEILQWKGIDENPWYRHCL